MQEKRTHTRVALKDIREAPTNGIYITKDELHKYGIFTALLFLLLSFFALFSRKGRKG